MEEFGTIVEDELEVAEFGTVVSDAEPEPERTDVPVVEFGTVVDDEPTTGEVVARGKTALYYVWPVRGGSGPILVPHTP